MILEIKEISKSYGTKQALKSFSAKLEMVSMGFWERTELVNLR